jgi:hypothetical protein
MNLDQQFWPERANVLNTRLHTGSEYHVLLMRRRHHVLQTDSPLTSLWHMKMLQSFTNAPGVGAHEIHQYRTKWENVWPCEFNYGEVTCLNRLFYWLFLSRRLHLAGRLYNFLMLFPFRVVSHFLPWLLWKRKWTLLSIRRGEFLD